MLVTTGVARPDADLPLLQQPAEPDRDLHLIERSLKFLPTLGSVSSSASLRSPLHSDFLSLQAAREESLRRYSSDMKALIQQHGLCGHAEKLLPPWDVDVLVVATWATYASLCDTALAVNSHRDSPLRTQLESGGVLYQNAATMAVIRYLTAPVI
jgi:hypothetical protein